MRTLIYVPVIHSSTDLGSLLEAVTKRGTADLGKDVWKEHLMTIEGFWDAVSIYFNYVDEPGLKIYQDGMVADGEIGKRIVEEGARSGSRNYQLVWRFLKKGAILVKTEDFILVKEERDRLFTLTQAKSIRQKLIAYIKYMIIKNILLNKRDKSIAKRINETLNDNERGVLFIGAFHNIKKWLAKDIQIKEIKDVRKIREYHKLLPFCNKYKERFNELAMYLLSKVDMQKEDEKMEDLFTAIRKIVCEQLSVKSEEVKLESSFIDDLGADSLDTVELIMALEEKFDIEISDEDAEKMYTVGDVIKYIQTKVGLSSMQKNKV